VAETGLDLKGNGGKNWSPVSRGVILFHCARTILSEIEDGMIVRLFALDQRNRSCRICANKAIVQNVDGIVGRGNSIKKKKETRVVCGRLAQRTRRPSGGGGATILISKLGTDSRGRTIARVVTWSGVHNHAIAND